METIGKGRHRLQRADRSALGVVERGIHESVEREQPSRDGFPEPGHSALARQSHPASNASPRPRAILNTIRRNLNGLTRASVRAMAKRGAPPRWIKMRRGERPRRAVSNSAPRRRRPMSALDFAARSAERSAQRRKISTPARPKTRANRETRRAFLARQVAGGDDDANGRACATAARAAAWSSSRTRTPAKSISPTSAANCSTARPAAASTTAAASGASPIASS